MSNSIMYSSHAMTHFNLVRLFLRRTMSTQHLSRVEMSPANTSADGKFDRNVMFEFVGDLVQTSKNCSVKHERTFNFSAADLRQVLEQVWKMMWYVFWWKPGYSDLLSYVTFLLEGVIGKRVTDTQSLLVHDDAMNNFLLFFFSTLVLV